MPHRAEIPPAPWKRRFLFLFAFTVLLPAAILLWLAGRFGGDIPVDYADPVEHFKYGSTGGEHEMGFPYWIWRALPEVCGQYLPGPGYQSIGMLYEKKPDGSLRDLPVGTSRRRYQGVDRVFVNCAVCHTSTVRTAADQPPVLVPGMPAAQFNMKAFEEFFFRCAADPRFSKEYLIPEIQRQGADLDLLDRYLVYPLAISIMRDRVLALKGRFEWVFEQKAWGPGRVDTFNSAKVIFNFPMHRLDPKEFDAPADFPSLWLQRPRREPRAMELHWDGNNTDMTERNKSAAFGTGTTPPPGGTRVAQFGEIHVFELADPEPLAHLEGPGQLSIETPALAVTSSALGTGAKGSFTLNLHLGARASGPSQVSTPTFQLKDAKGTTATAVAVRGARIVAVGSDADVRDYIGPDTQVIELGGNDALRGLPLAMTRDNLVAMVKAAKTAGAKVMVVGMQLPPNYGARYGQDFAALFADVAKAEGAALVPFLLAGVADGPNAEQLFQPDRIHPVAAAHPRMLANVWAVMKGWLK